MSDFKMGNVFDKSTSGIKMPRWMIHTMLFTDNYALVRFVNENVLPNGEVTSIVVNEHGAIILFYMAWVDEDE